ncbi:hypothetical protein A2962_01625 [Candidatus Woesebacteria bacterium RIFCSPLOWO2_01_FULL_39_61]|uniref:Nucleotidyl transferase AbiEii toxin, Type IV TA system n=1 Tax=Candidatus Woesebacteria bacterium RIFCSPHIGHO2_02_FULL_39_13 TaxID=1802505 RepID=A0A1F7Z4Z0_9BACT|nr:MAG: hypothetical protein A2692_01865 [Candidatus Woesebacteria bacterium RIFCSPHIGHO2_01_FULL_39_95]OGM34544.1 MAG: hypothetical protein A3D01_03315 [Candidatus Woesebacteria bacterium RIFCSPHIGHO2_02_FULL_39_13]OGM38811.1 MAG: hypothetical protein A3E13_01210 [Candidatus Woesebacteria bacterium RIFCSPHIGHO2_12_FULL_40_20]OGM65817.1 MAG: hypothetical protein A2962_01625 [Candidatus Woesebacteria bacterium RIFCSPLOWO2_01_FULL_39_61]OGM71630.1 MAG: hypothetical protein A3H19_04925 [Candidatus
MHEEILSENQKRLLPLLNRFSGKFGLVGGTAIALHIGHRRSLDLDLATLESTKNEKVANEVRSLYSIESVLVDEVNELSIVVESVKLTFFTYPFHIEFTDKLTQVLKMPDLVTLSSMKAYALGRRAKWKDYVDLYFVFKNYSLKDVVDKSKGIFKGEFNEKLFREELSYFEDIDYSEEIDYMEGFKTNDDVIRNALKEVSLQK